MMKTEVTGILTTLLLMGILTSTLNVMSAESGSTTWTVDDDGPADFHTIQEAINAADENHTIYVKDGRYHENVVVNKTLTLLGENRPSVIIDGQWKGKTVVITTNNVVFSNFTIQYGGLGMQMASRCNISNNLLTHNSYGINGQWGVSHNLFSHNLFVKNLIGLQLYSTSDRNHLVSNTFQDNKVGIRLENSVENTVFHNTFIDNTRQVIIRRYEGSWNTSYANFWDDGTEGNYWSNYRERYPNATDSNGDGIWDTPYIIDAQNKDHHPLTSPYPYWKDPSPCDLNRDMKVDLQDINIAISAFGSHPRTPNWNPNADLTGSAHQEPDNKVDMRDLGLIAKSYTETLH